METFLPCKNCAAPVAVLPDLLGVAQDWGVLCPACLAAQGTQARHGSDMDARRARFLRLCPPCFSDTDLSRLPQPTRSATALKWSYGLQGLNLWGWRGTGKSRTMSLIIEREVNAGRRVVALGPGGFRQGCEEREFKRGHWLKTLGRVDVLFIDDIDKMSLTGNQEKDFFAVLNNRMGRLPILVTGNTRGAELETRFRLGGVLVDRIRRYCYSVHFGERDAQ
jgi:hypothetical protein